MHKTLASLQPELENRGLHMKTKLTRQISITPIDSTQIQQVLVNLIKNAMQAMTRGGTLTLQTGEGDEGVWVSVADTGGGIPQEQINRIFDPFFTTKKKGTGLGRDQTAALRGMHSDQFGKPGHPGERKTRSRSNW